jgi:hypothetical protein
MVCEKLYTYQLANLNVMFIRSCRQICTDLSEFTIIRGDLTMKFQMQLLYKPGGAKNGFF